MFAAQHKLKNFVAILDYNKIQSFGSVAEVLNLEPLGAKWAAMNWHVREIDGHDHDQISAVLAEGDGDDERPCAVIAHTVKGKGVSFMENQLLWHYRSPTDDELAAALAELDA